MGRFETGAKPLHVFRGSKSKNKRQYQWGDRRALGSNPEIPFTFEGSEVLPTAAYGGRVTSVADVLCFPRPVLVLYCFIFMMVEMMLRFINIYFKMFYIAPM